MDTELNPNLMIPGLSLSPVTTHPSTLLTTTFISIGERVFIDQRTRFSVVKSHTALF